MAWNFNPLPRKPQKLGFGDTFKQAAGQALGQLVVDLPGKFVQDYVQKKMDEGGDWRGLTKTDEFVEGEAKTRELARGKTLADINLIRQGQIPQSQALSQLYGAQTGETQVRTKEIPASEEAQRYQAIAGGTSSLMHARTGRMAEDRMLRGQGISTSLELAKMAQDQQEFEWKANQAIKARAVGPRANPAAKEYAKLDAEETALIKSMSDLTTEATTQAMVDAKAMGIAENTPQWTQFVQTRTQAYTNIKGDTVVQRQRQLRGRKRKLLLDNPSLDQELIVIDDNGNEVVRKLSDEMGVVDKARWKTYGGGGKRITPEGTEVVESKVAEKAHPMWTPAIQAQEFLTRTTRNAQLDTLAKEKSNLELQLKVAKSDADRQRLAVEIEQRKLQIEQLKRELQQAPKATMPVFQSR
jgi:hypothetical protein